jgi:4-amino-4-deoxy-L-arabinose transferase-like glycosyltransferase
LTISRTSSTGYRWLGCALLLFLLQVLPFLSHKWLTDESWYAGPAFSIAHSDGVKDPEIGPNDLEHTFDARPPGTFLVMAPFFEAFGTGTVTARMGSVLAGLAIVVLVFALTREELGEGGAVLAAFLVASDNLIVLVSKAARPEALTVMAILTGLLAMKRYAGRRSLGWAALSGLLMAAGTMFHITLLGFIVSMGLLAMVIDRKRGDFVLRGAGVYSLGYLAGVMPFVVWLASAPVRRAGFHEEYLSRATGGSLLMKLAAESHRYRDLFGVGMVRGHGLASLPVRLPIPLLFAVATWMLWKYRRTWFWTEMILLIPTVLWLVETANRSSRYLSLLAPVFAMTIAAAVVAVRERERMHRWMMAAAVVVIVAQVGVNVVLLRGMQKANYNEVGVELRSVIPQGQTAYGTITFWMALRDSPFISYERTEPLMAAEQFGARYFIVGDPTMVNGTVAEDPFYVDLDGQMATIEARSDLVGEFADPYYGDLKVYRLREVWRPGSGSRSAGAKAPGSRGAIRGAEAPR